jgi:hypothetical protein
MRHTGQMAIRFDVIERQGVARLQILLPVGLYLQSGVKLKVDTNAREVSVPYSWCFSNLCVAAAPASRDLMRRPLQTTLARRFWRPKLGSFCQKATFGPFGLDVATPIARQAFLPGSRVEEICATVNWVRFAL